MLEGEVMIKCWVMNVTQELGLFWEPYNLGALWREDNYSRCGQSWLNLSSTIYELWNVEQIIWVLYISISSSMIKGSKQ